MGGERAVEGGGGMGMRVRCTHRVGDDAHQAPEYRGD